MSYETIQARLRRVPTQALGLDTWQFRRLTSPYGQEPREYSAWSRLPGLPTGKSFRQIYDEARGQWRQGMFQRFRTADDNPLPGLSLGDQALDPGQMVWAVVEQPTSGPGTVAYTLERQTALMADQNRKGGV